MKIKINAKDLQNMLKKSKGLELKKLDMDTQKGLLIEANENIRIIMNNNHTQLESILEGEIIESGMTVIPELTLNILENFKSGTLLITNKSIQYDTKEIEYMSVPRDDFNIINDKIDNFLFEIPEKELDFLLEVEYATSDDLTRPFLECIYVKNNMFVGLNGYYASLRFGNFKTDEEVLISKKTWKTLLKVIDKKSDNLVKVFKKDKLIKFEFKDYRVIGHSADYKYLRVEDIITDYYISKVKLNINDLIESVKLMDKLTKDEQLITLYIDDALKIETKTNMNIMTDKLEIQEFEGEKLEIHFNIKYLHDVLKKYKNEDVEMTFTSKMNPMFIRTNNKLEFLLPVRRS